MAPYAIISFVRIDLQFEYINRTSYDFPINGQGRWESCQENVKFVEKVKFPETM